jgi:hypothetical protein
MPADSRSSFLTWVMVAHTYILASQEAEIKIVVPSHPQTNGFQDPISKYSVVQVVKYLSEKPKALSSKESTNKKDDQVFYYFSF